jgi:hypothetical protein
MSCRQITDRCVLILLAIVMLWLAPARVRAEQSPGGFALLRRPTISQSQIASAMAAIYGSWIATGARRDG